MIAGAQRQRPLQAHLHHTRLADREGRLIVQKHNATEHLGRARHHVHARARGKNAGSRAVVPHICQPHQKAQRLPHATLDAEHLTALEVRHAITHQVQGDTLTRNRALGIPVNLHATHATVRSRRQCDKLVANRYRPVVQRARHDGSGAADTKAAVDRETGRIARARGRL